mmetsp:Transcript_23496/g.61801  ORF Transcript_23496/g.61801 Transcript_23496/m.61801 type:complete len:203 (-) Transcript_23496:130-738(-)
MPASESQRHKVVIIGDTSVGKTSIIQRYFQDSFDSVVEPTIGMDFQSRSVDVDGGSVRLQLWDTAGQERFRSLISNYMRGASGVLIAFDITRRKTFASISKWIQEVREVRGEDPVILILGNKADMEDDREITSEEAKRMAEEAQCRYMEVSAKTGDMVSELFLDMANALFKKHQAATPTKEEPGPGGFDLGPTPKKSHDCSC